MKLDNAFSARKPWAEWLRTNEDSTTTFNGKPSDLQHPNFHGGMNKGQGVYDFGGVVWQELSIYSAFAEALPISNATIEDVVFEEGDFSRADFSGTSFRNVRFNKTILSDANFSGATFHNCNLNRVNLTNANFDVKEIMETVIYGISAWDLHITEDAIQHRLVIEKTYEFYSDIIARGRIPAMVDDIELAQFVHYLSNHKRMRNTLNILNNRGVLLLGRFKQGGLERLYGLRDWFHAKNYMPMIFDFENPKNMDYSETIVTMSGLSKFVVADLSGDSVPHELHAILSVFTKPVVAYYEDSPYSMFKDLKRKNRYVHGVRYDGSQSDLLGQLKVYVDQVEDDYQSIVAELAAEYLPSGESTN